MILTLSLGERLSMQLSLRFIVINIILVTGCQESSIEPINLSNSPGDLEIFSRNFISTSLNERDIAILSSGNEIIYTLGNYDQTLRCLVEIRFDNGRWGDKTILSFSGLHNDIEPFYSPDGSKLFFATDRPIDDKSERHDYNIWVSERNKMEWGVPIPLPEHINTENDNFYPAVSQNGNLYFTATRDNGVGREDIFLSRYINGTYQDPEPLDTMVNTPNFEFNAYINPDENLLIFSSFGREDGYGGGDLYYSTKNEIGQWSKSKNMGNKINSDKLDYCPFVDIPRNNFYFTSNRSQPLNKKINTIMEFNNQANGIINGMGNIYRISFSESGILKTGE